MSGKSAEKSVVLLHTELDKLEAIQLISECRMPKRMTIDEPKENRRLKQNRLAFKWYNELGKQTGEGKEHWRNYCKLTYGIPILREDEDVDAQFIKILDPLPYQSRLDAMEYMDVTSLMSVKQFAEYLTDVDLASTAAGFHLTHPDDLYWDALMREQR